MKNLGGESVFWYRFRCSLTIIFLVISLPFSVLYTIIVWLANFLTNTQQSNRTAVTDASKTVMITGGKMGKSLHFARWMWKNGYGIQLSAPYFAALRSSLLVLITVQNLTPALITFFSIENWRSM